MTEDTPAELAGTNTIIREMSKELHECANELTRHADCMETTGELVYAQDALNVVRNCFGSLRLDLLVARPLRAVERRRRDERARTSRIDSV